ncbi:MAG: carbohydrate ABC transporter substrate-binding protein [Clostridia bacterium]|nr:carbohydrate ABC transporter substrate-binding protein [Clostridia bacterium]
MKKMMKLTAMLLVLVIVFSMTGCTLSTQDVDEEVVYAKFTIGLPYDAEDANWEGIMNMLKDEENGFEFWNDAIVTVVSVPEVGTEEYADFIDDVYSGKVDMFLSPPSPELEKLIEEDKISTNTTMVKQDERLGEDMIPFYKDLCVESGRLSYAIPFMGSYQGLFFNTDVFARAEVEVPTDWASLNTVIAQLKEKGITPIAAGFADGARYWLDEMIFSEGGVAEHSAVPAKGIINSWARAVNKIKNLYDAGAFGASSATDTHDVAVAQFVNEEAAMIVCSSADLAGKVSTEAVKVMSFPVTDTGIKDKDSYIGKSEYNFYINYNSLKEEVDASTNLSGVMTELITAFMMEETFYVELFEQEGTFPFRASASASMDTPLEESAWEIINNANEADMPMSTYMLTFDNMENGLADVLLGTATVEDYLSDVTETELGAQAAKKEEALKKK